MNSTRTKFLYDSILFVVAVCLYIPSLWCGFVGDDVIYFIGNKLIRTFDAVTILRSGATGVDYLPLRDIGFAIDFQIWGENPFGFHLTNVILFGLTVVVVRRAFVLLNDYLCVDNKVGNVEVISFFAAIVVAIHPNHRAIVYAIFNRGALLMVLFSLCSLIAFLKFLKTETKSRYFFYAISLLMYISALMSREYCLTLPLAIALLVYYDRFSSDKMINIISLFPFLIIAETFFNIFKKYALNGQFIAEGALLTSDILSKASLAMKIIFFYMVRMVTSLGDFKFEESSNSHGFLAGVVITIFFAISFLKRNKFPQLYFGLIFYLVSLLPVLNLYNTIPVVAPRYSFLSCLGLFFILMCVPLNRRFRLIPILIISATFTWTIATMYKTDYWKDNVSFWEFHAARENSLYVDLQLGYAYFNGEEYGKAFEMLRLVPSAAMDTKYFDALGNSCFEIGNYSCAIQAFEKLMTFDESRTKAISSLRKTYLHIGDQSNAEKYREMLSTM